MMERLGALIRRRGRWIVGGWLVLIIVALPLAARQRDALTAGGFDTPGSQSRQVSERLGEQFPAVAPHRLTVLLAGPATASD
ncbi:MAG: hypothetical protein H0T43_12500, partial [Solirubrobacterales bacterium]|nr:hypothetical protein [Solirubrobacterales bacterium]